MSATLAILLQQIMSSPLRAVIDAQSESAKATLDFISNAMEKKSGKLVPKSVDMSYTHTYIDPDSGELKSEDLTLSIPLVTMVPIPYISVDEVEIEFDAKIVAVKPEKKTGMMYLYAVYSPRSTPRIDLSGEMHVRIKARRTDIPEGIAGMITALTNSLKIEGEK